MREPPEPTTIQDGATEPLAPGRPEASELDARARAILAASVAVDIGLRTAVASMVSAVTAPWVLAPGNLKRDLDRLGFYAGLAERADASVTFPEPVGPVDVRSRRHTDRIPGPLGFHPRDGRAESLSFESPFVAMNPAMRTSYAKRTRNRTARAHWWRHDDGPRPTLVVIHGFMASPYWFNSAFFSLPWFYAHGLDVVFYVLPHHGERRARGDLLNGAGYFQHGVAHFNESVAHAVHDFRLLVDVLEAAGVQRVGVTGLSLGGFTSALLAAAEPRLHLAIPNAPVTDVASLVGSWFPAGAMLAAAMAVNGGDLDALRRAVAATSPLTYAPRLDRERLMIVGGLGDRLAPPSQSEALWEHWGRPRLHWYPGNHTLHVNRSAYLREMGRFMRSTGFSEG